MDENHLKWMITTCLHEERNTMLLEPLNVKDICVRFYVLEWKYGIRSWNHLEYLFKVDDNHLYVTWIRAATNKLYACPANYLRGVIKCGSH